MAVRQEGITPFQLIVLVLSFYVIGALLADLFLTLPAEVSRLLGYMDWVVCGFFFVDFCLRLRAAPNKWRYMRWGWLDLLACIPPGPFQGARLFRIVQMLRVIRAVKSVHMIWRVLFRNRAEGVFASAATATLLLVAFGAITMLLVESPHPQSPIDTAEEALWWAFVTVTTVGYGDYYPITTLGRVVAVFLMVGGVGLFGSFAAYIGSLVVSDDSEHESRQHKADREMMRHLSRQIESLHGEVAALKRTLDARDEEAADRHALAKQAPCED